MKISALKQTVIITQGFPGTYIWKGGTSYYADKSPVHFSINGGDNDEFTLFHVTPDVLDGTNIGIYFNKDGFSNVNDKSLPSHKAQQWQDWWKNNQEAVKQAAQEFWNKVQGLA